MDRGEWRGTYAAMVDDQDYQALSTNAKLVLWTLKYSPHNSAAGIFICYQEPLLLQTRLAPTQISKAMGELEDRRWIVCEYPVLWIRNQLRWDPARPLASANRRKFIQRTLNGLPKCALLREYAEYYDLDVDECWPEERRGQADIAGLTKPKPRKMSAPTGFDEFWHAYPRKTAKADARAAWKKHGAKLPPLVDILHAVERQKATRQWQEGVIPHASTWINQQRWEDMEAAPGGGWSEEERERLRELQEAAGGEK